MRLTKSARSERWLVVRGEDVIAVELVGADIALRALVRPRPAAFVGRQRRRAIRFEATVRRVVRRAVRSDRQHRQQVRRRTLQTQRAEQRIGLCR